MGPVSSHYFLPGEATLDNDVPTTEEQFEEGHEKNMAVLKQCMSFLHRIYKVQPSVLSVENRLEFVRSRMANNKTETTSNKEE